MLILKIYAYIIDNSLIRIIPVVNWAQKRHSCKWAQQQTPFSLLIQERQEIIILYVVGEGLSDYEKVLSYLVCVSNECNLNVT